MVNGIINERPKDSINKNLSTGELELKVKDLQILNQIKKTYLFQYLYMIMKIQKRNSG